MKKFKRQYKDIITVPNLLTAWRAFLHDKRKRPDVLLFQARLMDNLFMLHRALLTKIYTHGGYTAFKISDPKPRSIHKATVRDRLLHHLVYQELYGYFDSTFIYDSYSCRIGKGTHKAMVQFKNFARIVSKNNTQTCWILKCDIKKFFANIDHQVLKNVLAENIEDTDILWLLGRIIDSFNTEEKQLVGLPLGNLTSQLLVNIYMNKFDQYVKRELRLKHYIRYADDFVIFSKDKKYLENLLLKVSEFLSKKLKLSLHPDKVFITTFASGVDFLGWVHFPYHCTLRTSTKKRMIRKLSESNFDKATCCSYRGMLEHGNAYTLEKRVGLLSIHCK